MCRMQNTCTKFYDVHPLSRLQQALFIDSCLSKIKKDHVVGWHAFLNFGIRSVMLPQIHSRQQQRLLEEFYGCHLMQLPQGGSLCTYSTIMFHQPEPQACNLKPIDTLSETPKKMMEHHETLYWLTSLWWYWKCFLLHNHSRKKLLYNL